MPKAKTAQEEEYPYTCDSRATGYSNSDAAYGVSGHHDTDVDELASEFEYHVLTESSVGVERSQSGEACDFDMPESVHSADYDDVEAGDDGGDGRQYEDDAGYESSVHNSFNDNVSVCDSLNGKNNDFAEEEEEDNEVDNAIEDEGDNADAGQCDDYDDDIDGGQTQAGLSDNGRSLGKSKSKKKRKQHGHADDECNPDDPHACCYCGISSPACVVRCVTCNKWFCNSRGSTSTAHIVTHLVRNRHKEVALHPKSALEDTVLECYKCGNRNVFILGYIPARQSTVVMLLCRQPCASNASSTSLCKEIHFAANKWSPLINAARRFPSWLVSVPSAAVSRSARRITMPEINRLESVWSDARNATKQASLEDTSASTLGNSNSAIDLVDSAAKTHFSAEETKKLNSSAPSRKPGSASARQNASTAEKAKSLPQLNNAAQIGSTSMLSASTAAAALASGIKISSTLSAPAPAPASAPATTASNSNLDESTLSANADPITPTQLVYNDAYHYKKIMTPLVDLEAEYDKKVTESQTQDGIIVRWEMGLSKQHIAWFTLLKYELGEVRIAVGDELRLKRMSQSSPEPLWKAEGRVIKVPNSSGEEIGLEIHANAKEVPVQLTHDFSVDFIWKSTSFDRMKSALSSFAVDDNCMSGYLFHRLLGHDVPSLQDSSESTSSESNFSTCVDPAAYSAPGLPKLNQTQAHAVRAVLGQPLSLIQGPPGTGKTVTSATIVYHFVRGNTGKVLVCAPSNVAVDQLTSKIRELGLRVVRLSAKSREELDSPVRSLTLHEQVKSSNHPALSRLERMREERGELSPADQRKYLQIKSKAEYSILMDAQVITCTCVGAGDPRLRRFVFRHVLIDESTQATEPEMLIPLVRGAAQLVFIGDHLQLGPVVMSKKVAQAGFTRSLFERLILLGIRPIRLQVQYRMHPCLSEFPSNAFYDGSLQNGVTAAQRLRPDVAFPWPNPEKPMFFYASMGLEEFSSSGTSFLNRTEAVNCEKIVSRFLKCGVSPQQVGIITPYEGQRSFIVSYMSLSGNIDKDAIKDIEVSSVDSFQGREKDFIILSCVRSNTHHGIGFLSDPRRLNVALTRAKHGLVVLGNPRVLSRNGLWHHLLACFKDQNLLVEGPLGALRTAAFPLSRPRRMFTGPDARAYASRGQNSEPETQMITLKGLAITP